MSSRPGGPASAPTTAQRAHGAGRAIAAVGATRTASGTRWRGKATSSTASARSFRAPGRASRWTSSAPPTAPAASRATLCWRSAPPSSLAPASSWRRALARCGLRLWPRSPRPSAPWLASAPPFSPRRSRSPARKQMAAASSASSSALSSPRSGARAASAMRGRRPRGSSWTTSRALRWPRATAWRRSRRGSRRSPGPPRRPPRPRARLPSRRPCRRRMILRPEPFTPTPRRRLTAPGAGAPPPRRAASSSQRSLLPATSLVGSSERHSHSPRTAPLWPPHKRPLGGALFVRL
mmetsp:Transcript_37335/g.74349  ORF Transcript_37335/g.74349 Transcript_37335/m.74349 type:complete len:293 (+) Transcript_37335:254-1132(+)